MEKKILDKKQNTPKNKQLTTIYIRLLPVTQILKLHQSQIQLSVINR